MPLLRHLGAALLCAALATAARAETKQPASSGFTASGSLAGGGAVSGSEGDATDSGILELEAVLGYDLPQGLRPEIGVLVGLAPSGYLGLRPGVRWNLDLMPFYLRGALDFAAPSGAWRMRWIMGGGGVEMRITDLLGAFAEGDVGIPVASKAGFGFLVRAGVSFRL